MPVAEALTYLCPYCNREAPVGKPCAGCVKKGAKRRKAPAQAKVKKKSWEQDQSLDGLDLPDDDFDYDEFVAKEFGSSPHKKLGVKWYWWLLGVLLLVAVAVMALF